MAQPNSNKAQIAAFYENHHSRGKYDYLYGCQKRKELFIKLIGKGHKILEVGCRSGNLTQYFASGNEVVGVDIDRVALKLFHERLGCQGYWIDVDEEPLPFEDQSFDIVVFSEVMEHVRFPKKVLKEIHRVLKVGGKLIGSVPNAFRLRNRIRFFFGNPYENDLSHLRQYSYTILYNELSSNFNQVKIHPISGHLIGGGSIGVPLPAWLPLRIRALFALDLVFDGVKKQ